MQDEMKRLTAVLVHKMQIVYDKAYGRYVLLFHVDNPAFSYPYVGVAFAAQVAGMRPSGTSCCAAWPQVLARLSG